MSDARILARNTVARYGAVATDAVVGLLLLPYNLKHLGAADYGLWIMSATVASYVSFLDLGFGGGLVKFVSECRARSDPRRLSIMTSTVMVTLALLGAIAFVVMAGVAVSYERVFPVDARQATIGRIVLLLVALRLSLGLPLTVFGAVINGAQRYALNNAVSIVATLAAAAANVWAIDTGGGVVRIVTATTVVHLIASLAYVVNAYRVQPGLRVSPRLASRKALREVGGFSAYVLALDWAHRVNYSLDAVVIGVMLGPGAVATFTPASRVAQAMRDVTGQFQAVLFPAVVDMQTRGQRARLITLCVEGTRLSAALGVAVGIGLLVLAEPLLRAWVGPQMAGGAPALQALVVAMIMRVSHGVGAAILKGSGGHRYLMVTNAAMAVCNLVLSVLLVRPLGIFGVALGTAIPLTVGTLVVLPEVCGRLSFPVRRLWREALWSVLWPALPVAAGLWAWRHAAAPAHLLTVLAGGGAAALAYLGLVYAFGLTAEQRALLNARLRAAMA